MPTPKLLIANRGEIAARIQRTAHDLGFATVMVFSEADAHSPPVLAADEAVCLGPAPARDSYLSIERILEAARRTGATLVHPGFGFLAENADFARACAEAGLIFVGPSPEAIRVMGSKREAKRIVSRAGVPVIPGFELDDQSSEELVEACRKLDFPVLLKASAGGGGKGMRIIRSEADLTEGIASAQREAESAFGDATLLVERYIDEPRHIEIQILGDHQGNLVHLFERECSIQRRHQKIIEEAPSPALDEELRKRMGEAAIAVGRSVNYASAGTVELILAPDGRFYFLEVNTRLQVEHPVTELITGLDIVAEQLRIAQGESLGYTQEELRFTGAALECRLYAEDPENDFLPSTGRIIDFHVPRLAGLRVDSGVETGSDVSIHYDPMLAKVITSGRTRTEAIRRMQRALRQLSVHGPVTNRELLLDIISHPEFAEGRTHTHFIEQHFSEWRPAHDDALILAAALAATLAGVRSRSAANPLLPALASGFRNNRFAAQWVEYQIGERKVRVEYEVNSYGSMMLSLDGEAPRRASIAHWSEGEFILEVEGHLQRLRLVNEGNVFFVQGEAGAVVLEELPRFPEEQLEVAQGARVAPMPGKVVKVLVELDQTVEAGAVLVILEAMKMEHSVRAPEAGVIKRVLVQEGDQVEAGAVLVEQESGRPN